MASPRTRSSKAYRAKPRFREQAKLIGAYIRELRITRSWSLYEASDAMSVDLKHLQKIESGLLNVTLVTFLRIADGLGIPLSELFVLTRAPALKTARSATTSSKTSHVTYGGKARSSKRKPAAPKIAESSYKPRFGKTKLRP